MLGQCEIVKGKGKSKPVYEQISHFLKDQIKNELSPGDYLPPLSQMVKRWDVGYNTVKAAIKDLEQKGLVRNNSVRGKGALVLGRKERQKSKTVICHLRSCSYFDAFQLQIAEGIKRFAEEAGLDLLTLDFRESQDALVEILSYTSSYNIILRPPYPAPEFKEQIKRLYEKDANIVFFDDYLKDFGICSVSADHLDGAYQATTHLLKSHGFPVYYFGHENDELVCRFRLNGWSMAMREHGFSDLKNYICVVPYLGIGGHDLYFNHFQKVGMDFLNNLGSYPCSIFALNDYAAHAIYHAAEKTGKRIGSDIYLAGFGNLPLCDNLPIKLTSIDQNSESVGYEAAKMLNSQLYLFEKPKNVHIKVPVKLIIRESSV